VEKKKAKNYTIKEMEEWSKQELRSYILQLHRGFNTGNITEKIGSLENLVHQHAFAVDVFRNMGGCKKVVDKLDELSKNFQKTEENKAKQILNMFESMEDEILLMPEFLSLVGSSAEEGKSIKDIDVLYKQDKRSIKIQELIASQIDFNMRKDLHFLCDSHGPHGEYIPIYDLVLKRTRFTKRMPSSYIEMFSPMFCTGLIELYSVDRFKNLGLNIDCNVVCEALPNEQFTMVQIHKLGDKVKVFNKDGKELNIVSVNKAIVLLNKPIDCIVNAYVTKKDLFIFDILKWNTTELIDIPLSARLSFLSKFNLKMIENRWANNEEQLREILKDYTRQGFKSFAIKDRTKEYFSQIWKVYSPTNNIPIVFKTIISKVVLGEQNWKPLTSREGHGRFTFSKFNINKLYDKWAKFYLENDIRISIEPRIKGERYTIHCSDKEVSLFDIENRKKNNDKFNAHFNELIKKLKGHDCILDCKFVNDKFYVLDMIYLNNKDIHSSDLRSRKEAINFYFKDKTKHWERVSSIIIKDKPGLISAIRSQAKKKDIRSDGAILKVYSGQASKYSLDGSTIGLIEYYDSIDIILKVSNIIKRDNMFVYDVETNDGKKCGRTFSTNIKCEVGKSISLKPTNIFKMEHGSEIIKFGMFRPLVINNIEKRIFSSYDLDNYSTPKDEIKSLNYLCKFAESMNLTELEFSEIIKEKKAYLVDDITSLDLEETVMIDSVTPDLIEIEKEDVFIVAEGTKGKFVYQHHSRGLAPKDATSEEKTRLEKNVSIHGDLRMKMGDTNSLIGWTLATPGNAKKRDKFSQNVSTDKIVSIKKLSQPLEWLTIVTPNKREVRVEPKEMGATSKTAGKFQYIMDGKVIQGVVKKNRLYEYFLYDLPSKFKKLEGRWMIRALKLNRNPSDKESKIMTRYLMWKPIDQLPYSLIHIKRGRLGDSVDWTRKSKKDIDEQLKLTPDWRSYYKV